jgi:hypothetical protein
LLTDALAVHFKLTVESGQNANRPDVAVGAVSAPGYLPSSRDRLDTGWKRTTYETKVCFNLELNKTTQVCTRLLAVEAVLILVTSCSSSESDSATPSSAPITSAPTEPAPTAADVEDDFVVSKFVCADGYAAVDYEVSDAQRMEILAGGDGQ